LETLDLAKNRLTTLPASIGDLIALKTFSLYDNLIPIEIDNLINTADGRIRYRNYISYLLEKITQNQPLDACDRAYPFYDQYREILEKQCQTTKTETAKAVLELLERLQNQKKRNLDVIL